MEGLERPLHCLLQVVVDHSEAGIKQEIFFTEKRNKTEYSRNIICEFIWKIRQITRLWLRFLKEC